MDAFGWHFTKCGNLLCKIKSGHWVVCKLSEGAVIWKFKYYPSVNDLWRVIWKLNVMNKVKIFM